MASKSEFFTKPKDLHLPISRVKTIMKSSPEVEAVGPEPLYLVTKVTVEYYLPVNITSKIVVL